MTVPNSPRSLDIDLLSDSTDQGNQVPDSPALMKVSELVAQWDEKKNRIRLLEAAVASAKTDVANIEKELLPSAMSEAGVTSFRTKTGRSVTIDEVINGNIPALSTIEKLRGDERAALEARRAQAIAIVKEKWPGLVKTELNVSLGRGETEVASQMAELLRKQFGVTAELGETIHPMTLNSHFKELKNDGKLEEIPVEPFALYIGPLAKIK